MAQRLLILLGAFSMAMTILTTPAAVAEPATRSGQVTPVANVDLQRYQGRWLQLATIPQPFQTACARNDRAEYTVLPDGLVKVVNSCVRADGGLVALEGRARPAEPGATSRLEVTFARAGDEWLFTDPGTYWVIGLDRDYRWAVVGAPDRRSGFVLARSATLTATQVAQVAAVLLRNGYDVCRFRITAQDGGAPQLGPFC